MKNYDKFKKIIQGAVPEIGGTRASNIINKIDRYVNMDMIEVDDYLIDFLSPIGVADVLFAYGTLNRRDEFGNRKFLEVSDNGMFGGDAYNWEETPIFWNLKDDNFDNQSDEVKLVLIEIFIPS